jgi:hypothetical protein
MCLQCCTESDTYEGVFKNFTVIQATKDYFDIKAGHWGLVRCNDPEFWWDFNPTPAPSDIDGSDEAEKWYDNLSKFDEIFLLRPKVGELLVQDMNKLGLEPTAFNFLDYVGKFVKNNKPRKYSDV